MTGVRGLLWRLFAVLASLLLPAAIASAWLATVVTDSDAYVDTVGPLASDAAVQRAVTERLETTAASTVESTTGTSLNAGAREQVGAAVGTAVESAEFERAWRTANRTAHGEAVRILEDEGERQVTDDGRVVVELGPVYDSVIKTLGEEGLVDPALAPPVKVSVPLVRVNDLERAQEIYELLDAAGFWLPAFWLLLVVLTLLVAAERRRAAIWLALGSIGGLLLLVLGLVIARNVLIDELGSNSSYELIRSVWDVLVERLYWWIGVGFVVSIAVLVLMAVLGRRRPRAEPSPVG
ncbi:MAG TPA: hypothetical protein VNQ53_05255 [Nocardioides sp.]|nr:hypothetical protein [Nocardioides sp.]